MPRPTSRRRWFDAPALLRVAFQGALRPRPLPPRDELVNVFEFEEVAKQVLPQAAYAAIAGSDRRAFDRLTLRPRMCVPVLDLDLTVEILGERHFTPILVGPVADQRRFHADAEIATARGASAAQAAMIVSSRTTAPINEIAGVVITPLWCAIDVDAAMRQQADAAVAAGCKAICLSVNGGDGPSRPGWTAIRQVRQRLTVPMLVKGVRSVGDARAAVDHGAAGIIVSTHGGAGPTSIELLPSIVEAVGAKTVVLVDGSFRRGSDILKALALGARGVLVARPVMWALAGYGAPGVQTLLELLQTDLARHVAAMGVSRLDALHRGLVRMHWR